MYMNFEMFHLIRENWIERVIDWRQVNLFKSISERNNPIWPGVLSSSESTIHITF